jgi:DNA polymerase
MEFADRVIQTYRNEWAPYVPEFWYDMDRAARVAMGDTSQRPEKYYGVDFKLEGSWLTARLPSGRKLWYCDPWLMRGMAKRAWTKEEAGAFQATGQFPLAEAGEKVSQPQVCYRAQKQGRWVYVRAWGGLFVENVVQALARDLMVHAMFICEREHMPIVLTVHDEIVCEVDDNGQDWAKMLQQIMEDRPQWAIDMQVPVTAECWQGDRYRK